MHQPDPVLVADLFPEERSNLLALLRGLSDDQWHVQTACAGWTVKDVVAHLLGGDLGKLSRGRDGFTGLAPRPGEGFPRFIDRINAEWVEAAKRLSPRVLCDLLGMSGQEISAYFASLDPCALGEPVSWAGPGPAPVWLDIAREYTERWHHQQHIREAVDAPLLSNPQLMSPVIATFVYALPSAFRDVQAATGTAIQIDVRGVSGGGWTIVRKPDEWLLYSGLPTAADACVTMDQDIAWRLFTNGLSTENARRHVELSGDPELAARVLNAVAIIA